MFKPIIHCSWQLNVGEFKIPVEIYCDTIKESKNKNTLKVFWSNEPKELLPNVYNHLLKNYNNYDLIFTSEPNLLNKDISHIKNYMMFHCWCVAYAKECNGNFNKIFNVSTVVGDKSLLPGHLLRRELWDRQSEIKIPKNFYASSKGNLIKEGSKILGDTKYEMFDSQFHIAIENVNNDNMYTEKINDCMVTKTVPIYWGCPNINDVYNVKGIIQINSIDDLIKKINKITPSTYKQMKPYIEENYQIAMKLSETSLGSMIEKYI